MKKSEVKTVSQVAEGHPFEALGEAEHVDCPVFEDDEVYPAMKKWLAENIRCFGEPFEKAFPGYELRSLLGSNNEIVSFDARKIGAMGRRYSIDVPWKGKGKDKGGHNPCFVLYCVDGIGVVEEIAFGFPLSGTANYKVLGKNLGYSEMLAETLRLLKDRASDEIKDYRKKLQEIRSDHKYAMSVYHDYIACCAEDKQ